MSIGKKRTIIIIGAHVSLVGNSLFSFIYFWLKSVEVEILMFVDRVDTARGKRLKKLQKLLQ